MVARDEAYVNIEVVAEYSPNFRGELSSPVWDNVFRDAINPEHMMK